MYACPCAHSRSDRETSIDRGDPTRVSKGNPIKANRVLLAQVMATCVIVTMLVLCGASTINGSDRFDPCFIFIEIDSHFVQRSDRKFYPDKMLLYRKARRIGDSVHLIEKAPKEQNDCAV